MLRSKVAASVASLSERRSASSIFFCSSMSIDMPTQAYVTPSRSRIGVARDECHRN
jgi:hypothetical protein